MKSSEGLYFEKLDHLRALAVFLVFFWHFVHGSAAHPLVPLAYSPPSSLFPLSLLEEGHAGVALFMVLSGYLFARLTGDRDIIFAAFARNRFLRLMPMLVLMLVPEILRGRETTFTLLRGFLYGGWAADGTWSVMVEIQFYLLLPAVLYAARARPFIVLGGAVIAAIGLRTACYTAGANLKDLVSFSLVGHVDNFAAGIMLALFEARVGRRTYMRAAAVIFLAFVILYHAFNAAGGMTIASTSSVWIGLPTLESIGFAAGIHLYCGAKIALPRGIARAFAKIGEASYSIYLLQFFVITLCLSFAGPLRLSTWGFTAIAFASLVPFGLAFGLGRLTYRFIELPFLRWRVPYLREAPAETSLSLVAATA